MATLYTEDGDELDGLIAALEGVGKASALYARNRNVNNALAIREAQRRDRMFAEAKRLGLAQNADARAAAALKLQQDEAAVKTRQTEADRAAAAAGLEARYGGGGTPSGMPQSQSWGDMGRNMGDAMAGREPTQADSTLDPETMAAIQGARPFVKDMSPEGIKIFEEGISKSAKERQVKRARESLQARIQAIGAQVGPDGQPIPDDGKPKHSRDMLAGYHDPTETKKLLARLQGAETPAQLAAVESDLAELEGKRMRQVRMGEDIQNEITDLDPRFAEAFDANQKRVDAGGVDMYDTIDDLRTALLDLTRPGATDDMTPYQLRTTTNAIRRGLQRATHGIATDAARAGRGKAPEAEKGSQAYYDFIEQNPHAQFEHLAEQSKFLPEMERKKWVNDRYAEWKARHAQQPGAAGSAPAAPAGAAVAPQPAGSPAQAPTGAGQGFDSPEPVDRVRATWGMLEALKQQGPVAKEVAAAALKAARDGKPVEAAMRAAMAELNGRGRARAESLEHVGPNF